MQFTSYAFIILWAVTFSLYYLLPKKTQWYVLLAGSVVFYIAGLKGFPAGLLLTGITTYGCGLYLKRNLLQERDGLGRCSDKESKKSLKAVYQKKRKRVQSLYIIFNLGLLVFYKYAVIALPVIRELTGSQGGFLENVMMPLGISFYTLTAISYVIDAGRENCEVETDFLKVMLFLAWFPSVTQGPFNRFAQMKEQFEKEHVFQYDRMLRGIQRFVWGAFKKMVIADRLGFFVDRVYGMESSAVAGSIYACATVFYMLQLYADFSGYIDMAAGISETFGIVLPDNFKRPYFSKSVAEFWRRWHITLGTWFREYVYIPLGGNRKGHGKTIRNLLIVWGLTGLWHGASWNFILWGLYFGVLIVIERLGWGNVLKKLPSVVSGLYTFLIVVFGWVLFDTNTLSDAGQFFKAMFGGNGLGDSTAAYYMASNIVIFLLCIFASTDLFGKLAAAFKKKKGKLYAGVTPAVTAAVLLLCTSYLVDATYNPFLYFRF